MNRLRAIVTMAALLAPPAYVPGQPGNVKGVFVGIRNGAPVELIAWAESRFQGQLRMASGSLEDVPLVSSITRLLCSVPNWKPAGVIVASEEIFRSERAERRHLPISGRMLNVYTVELRVADLERPATVARLLRDVKASADDPGYVFVILQSGGLIRYYPFRIAP